MALVTEQRVRRLAQARIQRLVKSARMLLQEGATTAQTSFDVFLSHSIRDAELVLGVKAFLEERGLAVYVDWIIDPDLERDNVTPETAATLRRRMRQCRCLIYMHTLHSPTSKWMPWELGYFDGFKPDRVGILPIAKAEQSTFVGQEYLGLYPYIDEVPSQTNPSPILWINASANDYAMFENWVNETERISRH